MYIYYYYYYITYIILYYIILYYIIFLILYYIILYYISILYYIILILHIIYIHILILNIVKQEYGVLWYNSLTHTKTTRLLFFTLWQHKWWLFSVFPQTKSLIYVDIYIYIFIYLLFMYSHTYMYMYKIYIYISVIYMHVNMSCMVPPRLSRRRSRRSGKWIPKTSTRVPWLPWLQGEETASDVS